MAKVGEPVLQEKYYQSLMMSDPSFDLNHISSDATLLEENIALLGIGK